MFCFILVIISVIWLLLYFTESRSFFAWSRAVRLICNSLHFSLSLFTSFRVFLSVCRCLVSIKDILCFALSSFLIFSHCFSFCFKSSFLVFTSVSQFSTLLLYSCCFSSMKWNRCTLFWYLFFSFRIILFLLMPAFIRICLSSLGISRLHTWQNFLNLLITAPAEISVNFSIFGIRFAGNSFR